MIPVDNTQPEAFRRQEIQVASARSMAILAHLAVIIGLVLVGYRHFDNIHTGVAMATLYLLTFYTSQMTGLGGSRSPGCAYSLGHRGLSPPADCGNALGHSHKRDILSLVPVAVVVRILLAARCRATDHRRYFGADDHDHLAGNQHGHLGDLLAAIATDARLAQSLGDCFVGLLEISRTSIPHSRACSLRCAVLQSGPLAAAKEPRHSVELFSGRDAGLAILARQ